MIFAINFLLILTSGVLCVAFLLTFGWILHALRLTSYVIPERILYRPSRLWTLGSNAEKVEVSVED